MVWGLCCHVLSSDASRDFGGRRSRVELLLRHHNLQAWHNRTRRSGESTETTKKRRVPLRGALLQNPFTPNVASPCSVATPFDGLLGTSTPSHQGTVPTRCFRPLGQTAGLCGRAFEVSFTPPALLAILASFGVSRVWAAGFP